MPAFSMGKSPKKASFLNNINAPGVGTYSTDQKSSSKALRGPTFVIGKSVRLKTDKPIGPAPNIYDVTKNSFFADKSKGYHITGKVRQRIRSEGPGPGSYSISIPKMFTSKHYSFGIKTPIVKLKTNGPGPGDYDCEKVRYHHAISFQQSKRPSLEGSPVLKPGPGDYEKDGLRETKNKFAFPKRNKFFEDSQQIKQKTKIPGPGSYSNININSIKKQIIAARFAKTKRDMFDDTLNVPGPGAYSPTNSQKRSPVATIGNSPKSVKDKNIVPGPAAYNNLDISAIKRKQPSIVFGKTQRQDHDLQVEIKVGPGSYNIDYKQRAHAYSISGRNSQQKIEKFPGPLSYSPKYESQFRKTQMAIMGKDRKFQSQKQEVPGPGSYKVQEIINKSKTFYFPKQTRKWNLNNNPGPGTYEIKTLIGSDVSPTNKK